LLSNSFILLLNVAQEQSALNLEQFIQQNLSPVLEHGADLHIPLLKNPQFLTKLYTLPPISNDEYI